MISKIAHYSMLISYFIKKIILKKNLITFELIISYTCFRILNYAFIF